MTEGALVLEGGSLRGVFTAGVLDVFMEQGIEMSYVNGVSAGSMCGMSYVSKQIGRTIKVDLDYVNDKRFLSFRNMVKNRSIFNFDFHIILLDSVVFLQRIVVRSCSVFNL